jgi:putative flippase GtrA
VKLPEIPSLLHQSVRFVLVGGAATAGCMALYAALRQVLPLTIADLLAIAVTTFLGSEMHRRVTFSGQRAVGARMVVQNLASFAWSSVSTSTGLLVLDTLVPGATVAEEVAALLAMSAIGGTARFLALRFWVLRPRRPSTPPLPLVPAAAAA